MYTTAIIQTDRGYKLNVYEDSSMKLLYSKERSTYEKARQLSLDFMYRGLVACGGGSGDGSGNGRRRRPKPNVGTDDNGMF